MDCVKLMILRGLRRQREREEITLVPNKFCPDAQKCDRSLLGQLPAPLPMVITAIFPAVR